MDKDIKEIVELLSQTDRVFVEAVKNVLKQMVSESEANKYGRIKARNH